VSSSEPDADVPPVDLCPDDPVKTAPGECGCGVPDSDSDEDGTLDCNEGCASDPAKIAPGACGCGAVDDDRDGDGTATCHDACPDDASKTEPGACGCGLPDTDIDTDGDGVACGDRCPDDIAKLEPGFCGCGEVEDAVWASVLPDWQSIAGLDGGSARVSFAEADNASATLDLDFAFPFFGRTYRSIQVSTNGLIVVGSGPGGATSVNKAMPTAGEVDAVIAPFWDDLDNTIDSVWFLTQGSAPDRRAVISWNAVTFHEDPGVNTAFQVLLDEDGAITFQYLTSNDGNHPLARGSSATLGVENESGTQAYQYSFDSEVVTYQSAIRLGCD
jgi:hypothetical protein